jgi:hypothetical protein
MAKMVKAKQTAVQIPTAISTSSDCNRKLDLINAVLINLKFFIQTYSVERRESTKHKPLANGEKSEYNNIFRPASSEIIATGQNH